MKSIEEVIVAYDPKPEVVARQWMGAHYEGSSLQREHLVAKSSNVVVFGKRNEAVLRRG